MPAEKSSFDRADPIRAARGVVIGLLLCLPFWLVVAAFAHGARQSQLIAKRDQEATLGSSFRAASSEQAR